MGYYMGDYYYGDYYEGDPGRRGTGRPARRAQVVAKAVHTSGKKIATRSKTSHPTATKAKRGIFRRVAGRTIGIAGKVGGVATSFIPGVGGVAGGLISSGAEALGGKISAGGVMAEGGRRRRRMNVGNAKALRRAIRRATGFAKLARKVLRFTSAKPPKGRMYFKTSKKK